MGSEVEKILRVSVLDIVFQEKSAYTKENIICYLYLNEDILEDFEIKGNNHSVSIPIAEKNDKLGVMIQVKETGDIIGCISFLAQMFSSLPKQNFTQWVTLFDSPEDDEFDGDLGDDDDETPRILLKFDLETHHKISKVNIATENKDSVKETQKNTDHGDGKNVNEKLDFENTEKGNFMKKEVHAKNSCAKIVSVPVKNEKETETVQNNEQGAIELETKIDNLITVLESQRSMCQNSSRKELISSDNSKIPSEKDYFLQLEMEKNKLLEKSVKQLEEQLSKTEQLYKELEKQSHEKFNEVSEARTILNKENYDLKSRIAILEEQIGSGNFFQNSLETQKFKSLELELKKAKSERDEERTMVTRLKTEIKQLMSSNTNAFEDFKTKMEQFGQEIKSLHLEKGKLERTSASLKSKIEVFELENKSLQTDLEISQREVQRLTQEVDEFKQLGSSFRKVVDEVNKQKDKEINCLQEKIEDLNKSFYTLTQENDLLSTTNQQLEKNLELFKLLSSDDKIEDFEAKLIQAQNENEKLKEALQKNEGVESGFRSNRHHQEENNKLEFEINELKLKLNEAELVREKYGNMKKKIKLLQEENSGYKQKLDLMQQRLFATAAELVKQTSITVEQNNIIINLNQQMQILDSSLKTAFENITKLQSNIQQQQSQKKQDSNVSRIEEAGKKADIEAKLNSFLIQNGLPIKFIKDGNGFYTFGTKKLLNINIVNGRLSVTQADGSNLLLEDFIRFYANQEILKMKTSSSGSGHGHGEILEAERDNPSMNGVKLKAKRTKLESSQTNPSAKSLRPSRKSEASSIGYLANDSSEPETDKTSEFIIYDITPQGGHDTIVQTRSKRNSQEKILASNDFIQTRDHLSFENERKRKSSSSRSQDPLRNSLTNKIHSSKK